MPPRWRPITTSTTCQTATTIAAPTYDDIVEILDWHIEQNATGTSTGTFVWPTWAESATTTAAAIRSRVVWRAWLDERGGIVAETAERCRRQATLARRDANSRAEALLRSHLTPEQLAELDLRNGFSLDVHSPDGSKRRYRIDRGRSGNLYLLDENGRPAKRYCVHPIEAVPDADTMLAQKLMLETDEPGLIRLANATELRALGAR